MQGIIKVTTDNFKRVKNKIVKIHKISSSENLINFRLVTMKISCANVCKRFLNKVTK